MDAMKIITEGMIKEDRPESVSYTHLDVYKRQPAEIVGFLREKRMLPAKQVFEQTTPLDMSIGFKISARIAQDGHTCLLYTSRCV